MSNALVDSFQILFLSSRYFHCDSNLKRGFLRPYETLIIVGALVYKTCTLDRDISKNMNFEEKNIQMQIEMQIDDKQIHLFESRKFFERGNKILYSVGYLSLFPSVILSIRQC